MKTNKLMYAALVVYVLAAIYLITSNVNATNMVVYDFTVKDAKGNDVPMSNYKGKVLLIVNTATQCGFTPQYEGLQNLYAKLKDQGFEVLDFPCNQFKGQAPGTNEEIKAFCELKYKTTFQTFNKIDVNGDNADPLFKYLKSNTKGFINQSIKWNFTKFLVNKEGHVVKRYASTTEPAKIEKDILKLLAEEGK